MGAYQQGREGNKTDIFGTKKIRFLSAALAKYRQTLNRVCAERDKLFYENQELANRIKALTDDVNHFRTASINAAKALDEIKRLSAQNGKEVKE